MLMPESLFSCLLTCPRSPLLYPSKFLLLQNSCALCSAVSLASLSCPCPGDFPYRPAPPAPCQPLQLRAPEARRSPWLGVSALERGLNERGSDAREVPPPLFVESEDWFGRPPRFQLLERADKRDNEVKCPRHYGDVSAKHFIFISSPTIRGAYETAVLHVKQVANQQFDVVQSEASNVVPTSEVTRPGRWRGGPGRPDSRSRV